MMLQMMEPDVVRGGKLSIILGRAHAVSTLFMIRSRPGIGPTQLAALTGANSRTAKDLAEHFAEHGVIKIQLGKSTFPGRPNYHYYITKLGDQLAQSLDPIADLFPDEEEATPTAPEAWESVLDRLGAREGLIALYADDLPFEEFEKTIPTSSVEYPRSLWKHFLTAGLVDIVIVERKGKPVRALALTEKGRAVAARYVEMQRLMSGEPDEPRVAKKPRGPRG